MEIHNATLQVALVAVWEYCHLKVDAFLISRLVEHRLDSDSLGWPSLSCLDMALSYLAGLLTDADMPGAD